MITRATQAARANGRAGGAELLFDQYRKREKFAKPRFFVVEPHTTGFFAVVCINRFDGHYGTPTF